MSESTDVTWWTISAACLQVSYDEMFYHGDFQPLRAEFPGLIVPGSPEVKALTTELAICQLLNDYDETVEVVKQIYGDNPIRELRFIRNLLLINYNDIIQNQDLPKSFHDRTFLEEWASKGGWCGMTEEERLVVCINDPSISRHWHNTRDYHKR